mmetsp:Transcript_22116/g.41789  ORF Transcript_22116/g.41789 Transcript_22116/m.41789 type:complete len:116 (-) Transcript_22116:1125-1472(-)
MRHNIISLGLSLNTCYSHIFPCRGHHHHHHHFCSVHYVLPFFELAETLYFLSVVSSFANPLYLVEYPANPNLFTCITSGKALLSILSSPVAAREYSVARCRTSSFPASCNVSSSM